MTKSMTEQMKAPKISVKYGSNSRGKMVKSNKRSRVWLFIAFHFITSLDSSFLLSEYFRDGLFGGGGVGVGGDMMERKRNRGVEFLG